MRPKINNPKESDIQNSILEYLNAMGILCWRNNNIGVWDPTKKIYRKSTSCYHLKGISDILGIVDSRMLCIEVKRPKGSKVSADQIAFIEMINKHGGLAFVARSIDDVKRHLKDLGFEGYLDPAQTV